MSNDAGTDRARGWVAHLRAGGTTPWTDWTGSAPTPAPLRDLLPGAQQLEFLRRLNLLAGSSAHVRGDNDHLRTRLADEVLSAPAAGRGRADLPLVGVERGAFGARPVDPATLADRELARVGTSLLARRLVSMGPDPQPRSWTRPWRRRVRLVGDPLVVAEVGAEMAAHGRPQGGVHPYLVVAAQPLDVLVAHTWVRRCFEHGTHPWADWLEFWQGRRQLPPRADLAGAVRRWGARRPFVRIVTDHGRLAEQVGLDHVAPGTVPGADQSELARRVAAVVGMLVPMPERPDLMRTFQARMPATDCAPVALPESARPWLQPAAERMIRELRRADYPVLGDLADLMPRFDTMAGPAGADLDRSVLDLALRMVAASRTWTTHEEAR